ncbi:MAG: hypothetical protein GY798_29305 [Hyphomicrobiales bacterium]|nr:hypothetical protein [Hyphomicrobiales bacterium]
MTAIFTISPRCPQSHPLPFDIRKYKPDKRSTLTAVSLATSGFDKFRIDAYMGVGMYCETGFDRLFFDLLYAHYEYKERKTGAGDVTGTDSREK